MRAPLAVLALVLASSSSALAAEPPTFRLCTGSESGNYFRAGHMLKSKAGGLKIEVVPTQGSLDNLDKLSAGQCDGAFVQSDALLVY
ncbi:MAG: TRAP transporter substrate-binding protein, partial [Hyphomicrobiales bacterium]|nr:TRAP transporter substrate-binding protein [Hyphomicrobiales bacterium]